MNFNVCTIFFQFHTYTHPTISMLSHFKQPNCNLVGFDFLYTEVQHMNLYVPLQNFRIVLTLQIERSLHYNLLFHINTKTCWC